MISNSVVLVVADKKNSQNHVVLFTFKITKLLYTKTNVSNRSQFV